MINFEKYQGKLCDVKFKFNRITYAVLERLI